MRGRGGCGAALILWAAWVGVASPALAQTALIPPPAAPALAGADRSPAPSPTSPLAGTTRGRLGLVLPRPYERGKIPVVFIHGFWMDPSAWSSMIGHLRSDADLDARFQFWTFGYATGDPIPHAALLLRRALDEARRALDPRQADGALDQMVLVGHSMGGLLAKMQVVRSEDRLWNVLCAHPPVELRGEAGDREYLTESLIFRPRPEVRRVVFIATPHRGSRADGGALNRLGHRLVRATDVPVAARRRLIESNGVDFFTDAFARRLPTSIEELRADAPLLARLADLPIDPAVQAHSIIAVRPDARAGYPTDGIVALESARLAGVASEKLVPCGHILALEDAEVLAEVRRILRAHLAQVSLAAR